ncbi:MAG: DUF502 domain-containing protein [Planctomycetaceae bacterium]|nr:MAG: DUF502 domain-containing protein [Planctomycetaceae bacterium]
MLPIEEAASETASLPRVSTFRRAILRGLGVVLPPLLTVVLLIWAWSMIEANILQPIEAGIRHALVLGLSETKKELPPGTPWINPATPRDGFIYKGQRFVPDPTGRRFLPEYVVSLVDDRLDQLGPFEDVPTSANAYWHRYVQLRFLPRSITLPLFLIGFLGVLYILGKLFAHGIGRWFVHRLEAGIGRIPLINKVYGAVKQVTDFAFSEREIEFNRVVAIEYPREGIWSIGFVTGNGLPGIAKAAGEPVLSVLMPTSPMPMTGFTVTVRRSEAIDLDLTVDEAIQFFVSCGVVVPVPKAPSKGVNAAAMPGADRSLIA